MCGRLTLKTPESSIRSLFPEMEIPELKPSFNIAPTQQLACVRQSDQHPQFASLRWGLVPSWANELKMGARMINARSETVDTKPSFRSAFKQRRCLVIADGYYEWKAIGRSKLPFYMTTASAPGGFCMAGLWESWKDEQNNRVVETCTVLTTGANEKLAEVHDRMPVVLSPEDFDCWLDPEFESNERLKSLLVARPADFFDVCQVEQTVNNVRNNDGSCIKPFSYPLF